MNFEEQESPLNQEGDLTVTHSSPSAKPSAIFVSTCVLFGLFCYLGVIGPTIRLSAATIQVIMWAILLIGWILSVGLHEYGHALAAHFFGDESVMRNGYLDLNFLRYIDPTTSIILPLVFIVLGGFALPGGAIIHRAMPGEPLKEATISAAGPIGTLVAAVIYRLLMELFRTPSKTPTYFALAFLVYLEIMALVLNLAPLPPLDGWGIISPFLNNNCFLKNYLARNPRFGTKIALLTVLFIALVFVAVPEVSQAIFRLTTYCLIIPPEDLAAGQSMIYQTFARSV